MDKEIIIMVGALIFFFLISIIFIPWASAGTSEPSFFEDCASITDWTITSDWAVKGGIECAAKNTLGIEHNMTSAAIDLSATNITHANLTFSFDNNQLDAGEDYFRVYVNSSTDTFVQVFNTESNTAGSAEINLSEYITLDANVHLRGACNNNGGLEECLWDSINVTSFGAVETETTIVLDSNKTNLTEDGDVRFRNGVTYLLNTGAATVRTGIRLVSGNTDRFRGYFTFNTSLIPDDAVITNITFGGFVGQVDEEDPAINFTIMDKPGEDHTSDSVLFDDMGGPALVRFFNVSSQAFTLFDMGPTANTLLQGNLTGNNRFFFGMTNALNGTPTANIVTNIRSQDHATVFDRPNLTVMYHLGTPQITLNAPENLTNFTRVGNIILNATIVDENDATIDEIVFYGAPGETPSINDTIAIFLNEANDTALTFNWTAPVPQNEPGVTELLIRFDNRSIFGENTNSVKDLSNNDFEGIVSGARWNWTTSVLGGAYEFDGANDNIDFGDQDELIGRGQTYMMWIHPLSVTGTQTILDKKVLLPSHGFRINMSGTDLGVVGDNTTTTASNFFTLDVWTHLAIVISDFGRVDIYRDGILHTSSTENIRITDNILSLKLGESAAGVQDFNGLIDELVITNEEKLPEEILDVARLSDDIYHWNVNATTNDNTNLSLTNVFEILPPVPMVTLDYPPADFLIPDGATDFNSSATDDSNLLNASLFLSNLADFQAGIWEINQTVNVSGVDNTTTFSVTLGKESFVWLYNVLYCDDSSNCETASRNFTFQVQGDIVPGGEDGGETTAEIAANFTHLNLSTTGFITSSNTRLYLPFTINLTDDTTDFTENNNDALLKNGALWNSTGFIGGSMTFDGINDYIEIADNPSLEPSTGFTIAFWIKTKVTTKRVVLQKDANGYSVRTIEPKGIHLRVGRKATDVVETTTNISDGEWHHVVFSYVGDLDAAVYVDGADVTTTNKPRTPRFSNKPLVIGSKSGLLPLNGSIDELFLLSGALTASEVSDLYNNQSDIFFSRGNRTFKLRDVSSTGNEDRVNISANITEHFSSVLNVTVGDKSGDDYVYGDEFAFVDGEAKDIPITTPANISIRFIFYAGNETGINNFYTPTVTGDFVLTGYEAVAAADTCTYTSGDWVIACADNCVITSAVSIDAGGDIVITGTGKFTVDGVAISNYDNFKVNPSGGRCDVFLINGGNIFG